MSDLLTLAYGYTDAAFAATGELNPGLVLVRTPAGRIGVSALRLGDAEHKEAVSELLRELFARIGASEYLIAYEAWIKTMEGSQAEAEAVAKRGIAADPERREVVFYYYEGPTGAEHVYREIIRGEQVTLGQPAEFPGEMMTQGRFTGLLPVTGPMQ